MQCSNARLLCSDGSGLLNELNLNNSVSSLTPPRGNQLIANLRSGVLTFFFRGGKERLIRTLDCLSVASPDLDFSLIGQETKGI